MNKITSILIIDDHPLVADGISAMLRDAPKLQIIGSCKTANESLQFLNQHSPDVILLDISLPDKDGLQLCELIRSKNNNSKIIGLTSTNEAGIITGLLQRGGNGYLLKNMERKDLLEAIAAVTAGKIYLSAAANEKVLRQFQRVGTIDSKPVLTRREKEILLLLAEGLNGPEIAGKLFLSPLTVETHRKNLLRKFNAHSVQSLLKTARDFNLL
ncbi:MAG: response regulator transcription factor [Cyclobacteriaceae bacterium]|nr:response regulator transcription factor [Cyclobacteriaceae bacterium]